MQGNEILYTVKNNLFFLTLICIIASSSILLFPKLFVVSISLVALLLLLFVKTGLWRTMVLITLAVTVVRSSNLVLIPNENYWHFLQLSPLFVLILMLILKPFQKLRKADMLVIAYIVIFNVVALFTSIISSYPSNSFSHTILLIFISVFLILSYIKRWVRQDTIRGDLFLIYIFLVFVGLVSIVLLILSPEVVIADYGRFKGVYSNANYVGMVSVIGIMLGVHLHFIQETKMRYLHFIGIAILFINLVLSGSRGALVALFMGFLILLVFKEFRKQMFKYFLALIPVFILGVLYLLSSKLESLLGNFNRTAQNSDITSGRLEIYYTFFQHWLDSPIFGVGYRNAELLDGVTGISPHNIYLSVLTEMGIVGLIIFLLLLTTILFSVKKQGEHKILIGTVITILTIELTESSIFGFGGPTALISWLIILMYAALRNENRFEINR